MDELLPAAIGMRMAINQQNVALSMIKKSAEAGQQIADMVLQGALNVAASTRGSHVDLSA